MVWVLNSRLEANQRSRVRLAAVLLFKVTTLGELMMLTTHICLCHESEKFSTSHRAVICSKTGKVTVGEASHFPRVVHPQTNSIS